MGKGAGGYTTLKLWYTMVMKALVVISTLALLFLWAPDALAQEPETLEQLVSELYSASLSVVGLAAFIMLLYAGVLRILGKAQESNQIIEDAIIGTVLLLSAVVILNSISDTFTKRERPWPELEVQEGSQ
jgi:hypothetical protein